MAMLARGKRAPTHNVILYALLAIVWVGLGVVALAGWLPGNPTAGEVHLARELGAAGVFVGWMHAWCIRNYERRLGVHLGLMVFAALFAAIHWYDWTVDRRDLSSPVVSSVPLLLLAAMLGSSRTRTG